MDKWRGNLQTAGFQAYNKTVFYREHFQENLRYILTFNHEMYLDQQEHFKNRLEKTESFLRFCNEDLSKAQKSRNQKTTENKIERGLKKAKMHKVFNWKLEPLSLTLTSKKGKEHVVKSFQISFSIDETQLQKQKYLNGITCFVTNQSLEKLSSPNAIGYYRRKYKIEDAFRHLKDNLKLRPFYLTCEERVKAHVTICTLGYLLMNALEERLREQGNHTKGQNVLDVLRKCFLNQISFKNHKAYVESITEITMEQEELLIQLGLEHLVSKKYINNIMEKYTM